MTAGGAREAGSDALPERRIAGGRIGVLPLITKVPSPARPVPAGPGQVDAFPPLTEHQNATIAHLLLSGDER